MNNSDITNNEIVHMKKDGIEFIQFKRLKKFEDILTHCFTTRIGGVSEGECSSMNMGFNRNDKRENVEVNYKRISKALGLDYRNMVFSNQVHDNKVRRVTAEDKGKGIVRSSDIIGVDGLVTNEKQVVLVTFYADCVPLFFFDPVKKVIALSHSGWRSTIKAIGKETLREMHDLYGCSSADIIAGIGPSISKCCFEVGDEVYDEFINAFPWCHNMCIKGNEGKWHIDLQEIIKKSLIEEGLKDENISISGICTKCNNDLFFSHRGDKGKTGSLAAIMQIN